MLKSNKVAQGILNALHKLKKASIDRRLARLTGTSALQYCTEISYEQGSLSWSYKILQVDWSL